MSGGGASLGVLARGPPDSTGQRLLRGKNRPDVEAELCWGAFRHSHRQAAT